MKADSPPMSLTYRIRRPVVRFIKSGDVNYNQALEVIRRALEEARQNSPELQWDMIIDVSASKEIRTETQLRGIAMTLAQFRHMLSGRIALVVAGDTHLEQGRQFAGFVEQVGHQPRVFEKLDDAEAWLKSNRTGI